MIDWVVLVPIKRFSEGKRRLGDRPDRAALAEAFARDTLDAVAASPHVRMLLVVTDDPRLVDDLALPVAVTVVTQGAPGLNNAISAGLRVANDRWPDWGQAVLAGDLPALTPEDLERTFGIAEEVPLGLVADAHGTGTVMLTGQPGVPLLPAFGVGSAARHRALGHRLIRGTERLRRDVDTPQDLAAAMRLGVGRHTAALLEAAQISDAV
ncbi:2-phospho-L-lactate guanylyltransferase [Amnibacterium sp.]|uniref:2-phospho-L-lactate guanylyltransferase n=1 Tax=Amnibacterium sp. TaxID=1872496 RepID=UPI003F7CAFF2